MTGVRTDRGDLAADLVVDATGRRSPVDDWLTQAGARTSATWRAECGIAYFSRHYRVRPGAGLPAPLVTRIVVALDEFLAGKWGGDNGAVQLVVRRWPPTTGSGRPATRRSSPPSCGPSPPTGPGWR